LRTWLLTYFQGSVVCRVRGKHVNDFINGLSNKRYTIWNIRFREDGTCTFYTTIDHFFRMRPLLRETRCRIRVIRRIGFPFLLHQFRNRKVFIAGGLLFFLSLFVLTSIVWKIEVTGSPKIPEEKVLKLAEQLGVKRGQLKYRLPPLDEIKSQMVQRLEGAAWVGVEISGTKIKFEVVEKVLPEVKKPENPRHLVSSKDAVIVKILAEKGQPKVRVHQRVKKGDILISGLLGGEDESGAFQKIVVAAGKVEGLVWYKTEVILPLTQKRKHYTGNTMDRTYLVFGNRALKVKGFQDVPFKKFESKWDEKIVKWRDQPLPIRWIDEKLMEVVFYENKLTEGEAMSLAKERARADVMLKAGPSAKIQSEKVLHHDVQNDKVVLTTLYEVIENISLEQPIIKGD
jgi:similar to stage IV sporulation protein